MTPFLLIFEDAFKGPDGVRTEILAHDFKTVESPVDGVSYPGIQEACAGVESRMWLVLRQVFPRSVVDINFCFARVMTEGETQPHRIHQDKTMADYSAHVYLSPAICPGTGTQFWSHPLFGHRFDETAQTLPYAQLDDETFGPAWRRSMFVPAKYNRLLVHDSALWHSAEPSYGFGESKDDARLVLTTFFNLRPA